MLNTRRKLSVIILLTFDKVCKRKTIHTSHYFRAHFTHIMENVESRARYDSEQQNRECGVMTELVQTRDGDGDQMLGKQRIDGGKTGGW